MNFPIKQWFWAVALLPLFLTQPALAHVIWFEHINNTEQEIFFGHPEESQPEPLILEKFQEATAYDFNGNIISSTVRFENDRLFVNTNSPIAALTVFYDNGFWRQNPDDTYDNITQQEAEAINYENVGHYLKYAKGLSAWNSSLEQPFGLPLEIIALANPFSLREGDNLPIQVLFEGSLINNPLVEYLGQTINVDSNGIALIPVDESGLQVIEASYTVPNSNNPTISYAATFTAQSVPEPQLGLLNAITALGISQIGKKRSSKKV